MSTQQEPPPASSAALAGLAREVETLGRRLDGMAGVSGQVEDLARVVSQLAGEVAATGTIAERDPAPSWLDFPDRAGDAARRLLDDLTEWMARVYLRYGDAAERLPPCWLWHPDVVEELCWLMQMWLDAYRNEDATAAMAADWHDRYRPGVVRRIHDTAGTCSLEQHLHHVTTPTMSQPAAGPDARAAIAHWWITSRDGHGPQPTAEQLAAAPDGTRYRWGGRR